MFCGQLPVLSSCLWVNMELESRRARLDRHCPKGAPFAGAEQRCSITGLVGAVLTAHKRGQGSRTFWLGGPIWGGRQGGGDLSLHGCLQGDGVFQDVAPDLQPRHSDTLGSSWAWAPRQPTSSLKCLQEV